MCRDDQLVDSELVMADELMSLPHRIAQLEAVVIALECWRLACYLSGRQGSTVRTIEYSFGVAFGRCLARS